METDTTYQLIEGSGASCPECHRRFGTELWVMPGGLRVAEFADPEVAAEVGLLLETNQAKERLRLRLVHLLEEQDERFRRSSRHTAELLRMLAPYVAQVSTSAADAALSAARQCEEHAAEPPLNLG